MPKASRQGGTACREASAVNVERKLVTQCTRGTGEVEGSRGDIGGRLNLAGRERLFT